MKFITVLCVVLFSFQGLVAAKSFNPLEENDIQVEKPLNLLEELALVVDLEAENAFKQLKETSEKTLIQAEEVYSKILSQIEQVAEETLNLPELDGDIKECHLEQAAAIKAVIRRAIERKLKCLAGLKASLEKICKEAEAIIRKACDKIRTLIKEYKACKNRECRLKVIKKGIEEVEKTIKAIGNLIKKHCDEIIAAGKKACECIIKVLKDVIKELKPIADKIKKCIDSDERYE